MTVTVTVTVGFCITTDSDCGNSKRLRNLHLLQLYTVTAVCIAKSNSHCNGHCHGHCTVTVTCMGKTNSHCRLLKRSATFFSGPARDVGDGAWRGGAINMKSELIVAAGSRLGSCCFQIEPDSMAFFRVRFLRNNVPFKKWAKCMHTPSPRVVKGAQKPTMTHSYGSILASIGSI